MTKPAAVKSEFRATAALRNTHAASRKLNPLSGLSWELPSGEALAEFALRFGFLAPSLLGERVRWAKARETGLSRYGGIR